MGVRTSPFHSLIAVLSNLTRFWSLSLGPLCVVHMFHFCVCFLFWPVTVVLIIGGPPRSCCLIFIPTVQISWLLSDFFPLLSPLPTPLVLPFPEFTQFPLWISGTAHNIPGPFVISLLIFFDFALPSSMNLSLAIPSVPSIDITHLSLYSIIILLNNTLLINCLGWRCQRRVTRKEKSTMGI
jgi:hypothetical protein